MRKPIKPKINWKLEVPPKEPDKFLIKENILFEKEVCSDDDFIISLQELYDKINISNYNLKNFKIKCKYSHTSDNFYSNCSCYSSCSLIYYSEELIDNPNYEQEYDKYLKDLEKYNKAQEIYKNNLEKYKIELKKYNIEQKKLQLKDYEKQLSELETKKIHKRLKTKITKLQKEIYNLSE